MREAIGDSDTAPVGITITATARVLTTPELLDTILSHLPASGLFKMARLNREYRDTVYTSPAAHRTLFLRPRPALAGKWSLVRQRTQISFFNDRYTQAVQLSADVCPPHWSVEPITPAEVCPLLVRSTKASESQPVSRDGPVDRYLGHGDGARFAFDPENTTLLPGMMITNPSCRHVYVYLRYKHSLLPSVFLSVERIVHCTSASGLTLSGVLQSACEQTGDVFFTENRNEALGVRREGTSLGSEIAVEREERGGYFTIDFKRTMFRFRGMSVLSPKEWETCRRRVARVGEELQWRAGMR